MERHNGTGVLLVLGQFLLEVHTEASDIVLRNASLATSLACPPHCDDTLVATTFLSVISRPTEAILCCDSPLSSTVYCLSLSIESAACLRVVCPVCELSVAKQSAVLVVASIAAEDHHPHPPQHQQQPRESVKAKLSCLDQRHSIATLVNCISNCSSDSDSDSIEAQSTLPHRTQWSFMI
jgi:hypothetical protein